MESRCPECKEPYGDYYALGMHLTRTHKGKLKEFGDYLISAKNYNGDGDPETLTPEEKSRWKSLDKTINFGVSADGKKHILDRGDPMCGDRGIIRSEGISPEDLRGKFVTNMCSACSFLLEDRHDIDVMAFSDPSINAALKEEDSKGKAS